DLVEDEQDVFLTTDPGDSLQIARNRGIHSAGALNSFGDECSDIFGTDTLDGLLDLSRVVEGDSCGFRDQRVAAVAFAIEFKTRDGSAVGVQAVVGELAGKDDLLGVETFTLPVPASEFAGDVDGVGTAG